MSDFKVDTVIIGAGVVGLAIGNELSNQIKEKITECLIFAWDSCLLMVLLPMSPP